MGKWKDRNVTWHDQSMTYCVCCGMVIPKRYWETEIKGELQIFCQPDCENLYRDYVLSAETENGQG